MEPSDYVPFDHDCTRCEHVPICFLPLRVINKITHQWTGFNKRVLGRDHFCRQGRKRRGRPYMMPPEQSTIAQACEIAHRKALEREGVPAS